MSYPEKDGVAMEAQNTSQGSNQAEQMKARDKQLRRQLRRARIFVRSLDVGFGYS